VTSRPNMSIDPNTESKIHMLSVPDVFEFAGTRPEGLTQTEVEERLKRFGRNVIREVKGRPLILRFLANFTHVMAILLWAGGIVALFAQLPELAIAIWMVNVINGVFSFWQEYRAEKATKDLRRLLSQYATVIRDGKKKRILAEEVVPGDILSLSEGDRILADGRIIKESELRVDQSTLTGESNAVPRTEQAVLRSTSSPLELRNLVFAGTSVSSGTGRAVVFATAMGTEFGKIAHATQTLKEELSPLQKEMIHVTRIVTIIAVGLGLIFFVMAVLLAGIGLTEGIIFAMGMIVAFVPEGLLPTVTLSLAMGVQRMAKRHALVKKLSAVETLGCTNIICTDKTGTLTQNEMTVTNLWLGGQKLKVTGIGYLPKGQIINPEKPELKQPPEELQQLLIAGTLCNSARLLPPNDDSTHWTIIGDHTEGALLVLASKGGINIDEEMGRAECVRELPFESSRKRMTSVYRSNDSLIAYIKGSPKEIIELSTQIRLESKVKPLDDSIRAQILSANDEYARQGLRVLAIAIRPLSQISFSEDILANCDCNSIERDLTFLGLVGMMDPPRPEVSLAVQKCRRSGIRIIMVTGDYGLTAENIGRRIGIIQEGQPRIINGSELDTLDDKTLMKALEGEVIFARVAPTHKLRIVSILQHMGNIVAVTGDGVNDAPALKKADIGVTMGLTGTDVAKDAADMILTDDNFASIVSAIEEGRAVYANIKKFTSYVFTSNTPEAVPFILFAMSRGRIPLALNIMQVLSIDLGTDIMPALALGAEKPESNIMEKPPRNPKVHIVDKALLIKAYAFLGAIQSLFAMLAFYFVYWTNGYQGLWINLPSQGMLYQSATAMTLAAVVATQIGNLFTQRTERISFINSRPFENRLLFVGIATELALLCLIIYLPQFQKLFGTAPFAPLNWLVLLGLTPVLLLADEARKAFLRRSERHRN
jgi:P-type Ca2+ transporter type 2C